jgi:RNA polymerase sigma-70 factor (ECF subfamily)
MAEMAKPQENQSESGDKALASLLSEARAGDRHALSMLLSRLRDEVCARVRQMISQDLAIREADDDLTQEVLMEVFAGFTAFQGQTVPELRAWVGMILKNTVTDALRHVRAAKRDIRREEEGEDFLADQVADDRSPETHAVDAENAARLASAMDRLPANMREVVELRFHADLPYQEIASRLGISEGSARVLMFRAMNMLKALLENK